MSVWLDDSRPAPAGWFHLYSVQQTLDHIDNWWHAIDYMSLDHDLGEYAEFGGDGIRVLDYMAKINWWPKGIRIHSSSPVGADNMRRLINRYSPYPIVAHSYIFGEAPDAGWPAVTQSSWA